MKSRRIAIAVAALAVIAGSTALIVAQLAAEPPRGDPMAVWVCDHCGAEARAPLQNRSDDCPRCAEGQMVQRVWMRCSGCGALFEAYRVNWSPKAPRAADVREQADAHKALARECEEDPLLVQPPGEGWQWLDCMGGGGPFFTIRCAKCGREGGRSEFEKVLVPDAR